MNKAKKLSATLPNGQVITRSTKNDYKFVAVAKHPKTGEYVVSGWISRKELAVFVHMFWLFDECKSVKVDTIIIPVNA